MLKLRWIIPTLFAGTVACLALPIFDSFAQSYPVKPIRLVVGFGAGGAGDTIARIVGQKLSETLNQPVVVENRTGAGGTIATERVATSPADGYTLLIVLAPDAIQPVLRAKLPYDMERDFAPVSLLAIGAYVLVVHPSVPARNVKELLALARSQPGKLNYASSGVGSSAHFAGEVLNSMAKVRIVHVPYKSSSEASVAVASGHVDVGLPATAAAMPLLEAGKLKALAVTSLQRASLLPAVPTLDEAGVRGYDRTGWYGISAPAGVPKNIIARLNTVIGSLINAPGMKETLNKQGLDPQAGTPEQFAALIRNEIAQNAKLAKLIGLKVE